MSSPTFFRSPSLVSHFNTTPRLFRSFSHSPSRLAKAAQAGGTPNWAQQAAAATQREQQWSEYKRARRRRRLRNFLFFQLTFVPATVLYLIAYYPPSEQAVSERLAKNLQIRQLLEDATTRSLRDSYAEINLDKRVPASYTDQTLNSTALLGPKRAFWSHSQQELLYFQNFGLLLSGWPTVVHGGAVATAMSEAMSRAAACLEPRSEPLPEPSSLSLTYLKPTIVMKPYLVRVRPLDRSTTLPAGPSLPPIDSSLDRQGHDIGPQKDLTMRPLPSEPPVGNEEYLHLEATLENLDGKVLAKARAIFPRRR